MFRKFSHIRFREASFDERAADSVLFGCRHAGAIVSLVVEIGSVANDIHFQLCQPRFELRVQLGLAEVATVRRVRQVIVILKLFGLDDDMSYANLGR